MAVGRTPWKVALLACVGVAAMGCGGSHPARPVAVTRVQQSPMPPATHDSIALYNDTGHTVYVVGCVSCGVSGAPLAPGHWLPLNLVANNSQLRVRQPTRTTCLIALNGVDTGKPLTLKVSDSAATAC